MTDFTLSELEYLRTVMLSDRSRELGKWAQIAPMISPNRFNNSEYDRNMGQRKDQKIINNTARQSLRTFVSGMMNGATPRTRPWFKLTTLDESIKNSTPARRYFSQVEQIFHSHFQISNLYRVLPMAYKDVGAFSNAAFGMLPHPRFGFYFLPFSIGTYGFTNDSEGSVTTFFRDFTLTVRQTVEMFCPLKPTGHIDFSNMDSYVVEAWEAKRYNDFVHLTNIILPNRNPKPKALYAKDKVYQSYTYIRGTGGGLASQTSSKRTIKYNRSENPDFISLKGYDYFPVITPRWEVGAERDYGDEGPGEIALGDVLTLQELEKGRLDAVDKLRRPPMVGPSSLRRSQATILAGGITYLDDIDGTKQFRPAFTVDPRVNELLGAKVDYEGTIKKAFFEDLFLMLADDRMVSHVTKKEIEVRQSEKLAALGPVMGQLDQDQNRRIIDNAFIILGAQEGKLPERPKELQGHEIRPEYISILAQAQKASAITSSEKLVSFVAGSAQAFQDPALMKLIKADKMVRQYADFLGIDPTLIRDEVEYEQIVQQIAVRQQQAQAMAAQQQQSETAKTLSEAQVGEGNLLERQVG